MENYFTPITAEGAAQLAEAVAQAGAAYYGVPVSMTRAILQSDPTAQCATCGAAFMGDIDTETACPNPGCARNAERTRIAINQNELWTICTALGEYRDTLIKDLEREPNCPTYRQHLQEVVSLIDRLSEL